MGKKLDDSAFFPTPSYITGICYFEYLLSLLFRWQKPFFFLIQSNIKPNEICSPTLDFYFVIWKLGQVQVDLNIAQNHSANPYEVMSGHCCLMPQFT